MTRIIFKIVATTCIILVILSTLLIPINGYGGQYTFEKFLTLFKGESILISTQTINNILNIEVIPPIEANWGAFNWFKDFINGTSRIINKIIAVGGFVGVSAINMISAVGYYFAKLFP